MAAMSQLLAGCGTEDHLAPPIPAIQVGTASTEPAKLIPSAESELKKLIDSRKGATAPIAAMCECMN